MKRNTKLSKKKLSIEDAMKRVAKEDVRKYNLSISLHFLVNVLDSKKMTVQKQLIEQSNFYGLKKMYKITPKEC